MIGMNQATLLDRLGHTRDLHVIAENVRAMCEEYAPVTSFECFRLRQGDDDPVVLVRGRRRFGPRAAGADPRMPRCRSAPASA